MAIRDTRVHFLGIGGSGMSAVASYALKKGYIVDGCDIDLTSPYIQKLKSEIKIHKGHSLAHTKGKDILVVTPAVYFQRPQQEEVYESKNVMTWQEFLGKHLQKKKRVICIAGTHGKSTTTAMLSLVFEKAGLRPNVMVGATVPKWKANYRYKNGRYFITESDEFYNSFLNYTPEAIILNNIEFDHPDFFKNAKEIERSFKKHIESLIGKKILVANEDSPLVQRLLVKLRNTGINIYTYSFGHKHSDFRGVIAERTPDGTRFRLINTKERVVDEYFIKLPGDHNVSNAIGVIILCKLYSIKDSIVRSVLRDFSGIGRRLELLGAPNEIYVYDDYAHHPTAITATFQAIRQKHPISRIFVVMEPHSYSRTHALIKKYIGILSDAYRVIVAPIFKARDLHDFGINEEKLVKVIDHNNAQFIDSFDKIATELAKELRPKDVVLVTGAGKSHELSRKILAEL